MTAKTFTIVSSVLFAVVAVLHLLRLLLHWDVMIDGQPVPMWLSIVAAIVAGYLSYAGFRIVQQIQRYLS